MAFKTDDEIRAWLEENGPAEWENLLLCDGYPSALIGLHTEQWGGDRQALVYSRSAVIEILVERDGMDEDEATEFFEFNIAGAYVGENTPYFIQTITAP